MGNTSEQKTNDDCVVDCHLEGGLRLLVDGRIIGGIGVSGGQAPQDAQFAKAGADLPEK